VLLPVYIPMQKLYLLFICFSNTAFAQLAPKSIDSVMVRWGNELVQDTVMRSLSVGIVSAKGQWAYHFGPDKPGSQSVYEIGSVTKTFTSFVLAMAVREGKCNWQDDVRKYLPGSFPLMEYGGQPVRLIHLANTSTALPDNLPGNTVQTFLDTLQKIRPDTIPGTRVRHSNVAARLLVLVLQQIYAKPIAKLIQERILIPLGMQDTHFAEMNPTAQMPGFDANGKAAAVLRDSIWNGVGAMRSTVGDMMRYMQMLLTQQNADARTVLTPTIAIGAANNTVLNVPVKDTIDASRYFISLNWLHYHPSKNSYRIWTDGGTNGFRSYTVFYPDSGIAFVMLSNRTGPQVLDKLYRLGEKIHDWMIKTEQ
jgi:serine-type D-Ala-D-Ala carboxypeptidase/endopeptidase